MKATTLALLLLAACDAVPSSSSSSSSLDAMSEDEARHWRTRAALLDPRAYTLISHVGDSLLDVTVPAGHTWHVVNAFQVVIGDATIVSEDLDGYAGHYKSGFLRTCDADEALALSAGTRVRSNTLQNGAYVYFADVETVRAIDPRYDVDPRGLYFERLRKLEELPVRSIVIEMLSNRITGREPEVALPAELDGAIVTSASSYDVAWINVGRINLLDEVNNWHTVRFAQAMTCPFRRGAIGGDVMRTRGGNYAGLTQDTLAAGEWGELATGAWGKWDASQPPAYNPAAFNRRGAASITYVAIPEGF